MTPARLAWLNLTRRPLPTAIAVLAIAIAVGTSGILLRLNQLSFDRFATLGGGFDAIVGAKAGGIELLLNGLGGEGEYPGFVPFKLYESLRAERTVRFEDGAESRPSFLRGITPFVYFGRVAESGRAIGTDVSFFMKFPFSAGAFVNEDDLVVGDQIARANHWELGDRVVIRPWPGEGAEPVTFTIKGRLAPTHGNWDRHVYTSVASAQRVLAKLDLRERSIWGANVLNYFLTDLAPGGFAPLEALVNRRTVAQAVLVRDARDRLSALTATGTRIGLAVQILILILGGLSVAAMLITRFEAMALQLAMLRAIGYARGNIARWLLWEGFFLGLAAAGLGLLLDATMFPLVREALGPAVPAWIESSIFTSAPVWVTAILATTASVFVPLYRVYRQDVHFALRS